MPNRIIKESICSSDTVDGLSWFEEVFFYRLIVNCDDYGRMDARSKILNSKLFPLKTLTDKQVEQALNKLATAGIVYLYVVDGKKYLQLVTWERHQQVRAHKSKYPEPDINGYQMISDDCTCPRNPIQSESNPNLSLSDSVDDFFEAIWSLYPRKEGKGSVSKAQKQKLYKIGIEEMTRAVERYKDKLDADKTEKRFIKQGSTFFNSGYVDYLDANYSESEPDEVI